MKWQASLVHWKYGSSYDHCNVYTLLRKHISATASGHHVRIAEIQECFLPHAYWALIRVTFLILEGVSEVVTFYHFLRILSGEEETMALESEDTFSVSALLCFWPFDLVWASIISPSKGEQKWVMQEAGYMKSFWEQWMLVLAASTDLIMMSWLHWDGSTSLSLGAP